jgi:hypothetical protein
VSFHYTFYRESDRERDGAQAVRFAYQGALVSTNHWLWGLDETEGGRVEGYGYPAWIIAKAKFVIPQLLADFESHTGYPDQFKIYGDLTDFDDEELIEIEAWDQN